MQQIGRPANVFLFYQSANSAAEDMNVRKKWHAGYVGGPISWEGNIYG